MGCARGCDAELCVAPLSRRPPHGIRLGLGLGCGVGVRMRGLCLALPIFPPPIFPILSSPLSPPPPTGRLHLRVRVRELRVEARIESRI